LYIPQEASSDDEEFDPENRKKKKKKTEEKKERRKETKGRGPKEGARARNGNTVESGLQIDSRER
jgi:hypothetical protein